MAKKLLTLSLLVILTVMVFSSESKAQQYQIKSTFGDLTTCDTVTKGIYIVWYRKGQNVRAGLLSMLDSLMKYRNLCLNSYGLLDPPNVRDGYYFNIYMPKNNDSIPVKPGNGVSTDVNKYPFMVVNMGNQNGGYVNLAHETFHIFQYSNTSPGFDYSGDSQWFTEASANWFSAVVNPDNPDIFVEALSLVKLPHFPLWVSYDNYPATWPDNWQRYVHQYALAGLLYYLTEKANVPGTMFTDGFHAGTDDLPQQYLYKRMGGTALRNHFADWAMHMTNHFDFLTQIQVKRLEKEFRDYADAWDDKEFVLTLQDSGTNGWIRPVDSITTRAWSFNTFKLYNTSDTTYQFDIQGDAYGSKGSKAFFETRVLIQNRLTGARFLEPDMYNNDVTGTLRVHVTPDDTAIFLNVVSVPETFTDIAQIFGYRVRIHKGTAEPLPALDHCGPAMLESKQVIHDTIYGRYTHFTSGNCSVSLTSTGKIFPLLTSVVNDTVAVVQLRIQYHTAPTKYTLTITDSIDGTLMLSNAITVNPAAAIPVLLPLTQQHASRGELLSLQLQGRYTTFLYDSAANNIVFLYNGIPASDVKILSQHFTSDSTLSLILRIDSNGRAGDYGIGITDLLDGSMTLAQVIKVTAGTGLPEEIHSINLFPNPASAFLALNIPYVSSPEITIVITDIAGHEVKKTKTLVTEKELRLSVSLLEKGTYIVTLYTDELTYRAKFMKD